MNDVDRRLAEHGERWRAGQPDPAVDWAAATGAGRRPRGWLPVAVAAAAAALLTAGVALAVTHPSGGRSPAGPAAATPTASELAFDVPWVDRPAPAYVPPSPLPPPVQPAAPACRADELAVTDVHGSGVSQDDGVTIGLRNTAAVTCRLAGTPRAVAHGPGVPDSPLTPADSRPLPEPTGGNLAPGQVGSLWVKNPRSCTAWEDTHGSVPPGYTSLTLALPGGGQLTVPDVRLHAECGIGVTALSGPPVPDRYGPSPLDGLTATLTLPAGVRAGTTLDYVVTLANPTGSAVSTLPCPGYVEWTSTPGADIKAAYALNCDTVQSIGPGERVRYQMRLAVPAGTPTGAMTIQWTAVTGPAAPRASGHVRVVNDGVEPTGARGICDGALDGRTVTAAATTLGEVRAANFGGPSPGVTPGRTAFPDQPDSAPAAWCWVPDAQPSPGAAGRTFTLYVALPDGRSRYLFTLGGVDRPPTGPPTIP